MARAMGVENVLHRAEQPRPGSRSLARDIMARASRTPAEPARSSSSAASAARKLRRASRGGLAVASIELATWLAEACEPSSRRSQCSVVPYPSTLPAPAVAGVQESRSDWCASSVMSGPASACPAPLLRRAAATARLLRRNSRPDHRAGERHQRGRDHRFGAPSRVRSGRSATALRERRWGGCERAAPSM